MALIYYFTRSGDSEKIAKQIAEQAGGELRQITDDKNWKGIIGFIKGGYYATQKKKTDATYEKPTDGEAIYLCFPVWAGTFPPAVRTFIDDIGRDKIIVVASSGGGGLKDQEGFSKVIDIAGKDKNIKI